MAPSIGGIFWLCRQVRWTALLFLVALAATLSSHEARAQSIAAGANIWAPFNAMTNPTGQGCGGCHGTPPSLPQKNAGNAVAVFNAAIAANAGNFMGAYSGMSGTDRQSVALYIGSSGGVTESASHSVTVNYGSSGNLITPLNIGVSYTSASMTGLNGGTVQQIATTSGPTRGTLASSTLTTAGATFSYNHTATNCTADSITYQGSGVSGSLTQAKTVTINITPPTPPTISNSSANIAYNSSMSTNIPLTLGGGTATSLIVGALSGGAGTLNATGTTLTYTASASTYVASQTVSVQAVGPCATSAAATITINVAAPPVPVITSANMASGVGGQAFSFNVTASNAPTGFAASGLPAGLSINPTTGAITGTPSVSGMFTAMVTASNGSGTSTAQSLAINVTLATPVITSTLSANATSGSPFTYNITASNLPASFNATGLPTGLMINTSTGAITGTPVVAMAGTVAITLSATNTAGTGTATLMLNVSLNAPTITSANTASGNVGSAFTFNVTATDFPSSYGATGLPAGLSINTMTGVISGTPTSAGVSMVNLTATNGAGTGMQTLVITITLLPPVVSSGASVSGTVTQPVSYQITASNSPTSFGASGLPAGLSVNAMTGLISGSPTSTGTTVVTVSATNAAGTGTKAVTFSISNFPAPTMAGATIQVPFGGTGTVDFSLLSGGSNVTSYVITQPATRGTITVNGNVATYTPQAGFFGMDSFGVTAMGPGGTSQQGLITVIVGTPAAPTVAARSVTVPYNTQTVISLTAAVTGVATSIAITTPPANGTATVSGLTVLYKPKADYFGDDSFAYTATGPGGTSMPATVSITVATQAPSASAVSFAVPANTATTMDLKPFITGSAITGVRVTVEPKFGKSAVNGTKVVYTPNEDYLGPDSLSYIAFGNAGTSAAAVVTITVMGDRPNPLKSGTVGSIVSSQADTAQRNATTTITTLQTRNEALRRGGEVADASPAPRAPRAQGRVETSLTEGVTGTPADSRARPVSATAAPADAKGLQGTLAQAVSSRSVDLASVAQAASSGAVSQAPDRSVGAVNWWAAGTAQFGNRKGDGSFSGSEFTTSGMMFGVDKRFARDLAAGIAVGFMRDNTTLGTDGSANKARAATLSLYGSYQPTRDTFLDGLLGYGRLNFTSRRAIAANGSIAEADRDGTQFFASVAGGYEKRENGVLWSPYARLDYASNRLDQATENNAGLYSLTYGSFTQPSLQGVVGVRTESVHRTSYGGASPRARLEFRHEFQANRDTSVAYADLPGTRYALVSAQTLRNAIVASVGSDFQFSRGLTVGIDYQVTHVFNKDSNQGLRLTITQPLDGKGSPLFFTSLPTTPAKPKDYQADAGFMFDTNVTRAKAGPDKLSDRIYSVNTSKSELFTFEDRENIRATVTVLAGAEKFDRFSGLDRAVASIEADGKYKTSAEFDAYTFGATLSVAGDQYQSKLRRGYRASFTLSARQQLTDLIGVFAAASYNQRWANSKVFDNRFSAFRLNADYQWNANDTLYVTGEFRKGHSVSSGSGSLEDLAVAQIFVDDDAFPHRDFNAYRFEARTWISTVGYNMGFGPRHALDLSWRRAQSTPTFRPSYATSAKSYIADQYSIVYLIRF